MTAPREILVELSARPAVSADDRVEAPEFLVVSCACGQEVGLLGPWLPPEQLSGESEQECGRA